MTELRISELASSTGVPPTTLRYYEQVGLLTADRTPNGYRVYDERAIERLRFIRAAKRLDLSLDSIRGLLSAWEDEPCRTVKARLRSLVTARLEETRDGIAALTELQHSLHAGLQRLEALPDRDHACDPDCALIDDPATAASPDLAANTEPIEQLKAEPVMVACSLTGRAQQDRLAHWHELLSTGRLQPTPDGVTADITASRVSELTTLIIAEQQCCPFLRFELTFHGAVVRLIVTADDPALMADLLPEA